METKQKGVQAEIPLPTIEEIAEIKKQQTKEMVDEQNEALSKRTLKIWDVPTELANKFIATARGSYANKSWLYLQDLMRKANLYDEMVSSGRLEDLEKRIKNLEDYFEELLIKAEEMAQEEMAEKKGKKKPKVFGDDNE